MTREEAYNKMQEGLPVSHKDFSPEEFLWMDDQYIIRDENGNEFEASWDLQSTNYIFDTGWYIYKNSHKSKNKIFDKLNSKNLRGNIASFDQLVDHTGYISHMPGKMCPGKGNCLQYNTMAGETACVICDVNDEKRLVGDNITYRLEDKDFSVNVIDGIDITVAKEPNIFKRILKKFRRRKK